jgi:LysR family transcriptional regulator, glycine cleavage system transcriptional activator
MMALRAFEAGARLGSFTLAAEELLLTQSAISRHVRNLEIFLDVTLFHRSGRNLILTPEGHEYREAISDTFDRISAATVALCRRPQGTVLTVGMPPAFALKWLAPRLAMLFRACPDIELRVRTSHEPTDLDASGMDVALRYGRGDWLGGEAEEVLGEEILAVCSPALATGAPSWFTANARANVTLLHGTMREDWRMWLKQAGHDRLDALHLDSTRGPQFDDHASLIQAAIEGLGVALAPHLLVADDLAGNRLAAPFAVRLPSESSYWLVTPRGRAPHPRFEDFREWLLGEMRRAPGGTGQAAPSNL